MNLLYKILNSLEITDIVKIFSLTICFYIFRFYYKYFTRVNPLPGPLPIPLLGTFEIFRANKDNDAWFSKLTKKYGQNGIFELNLIGNRQIIITRAEYVNKFITPLSEDNHKTHFMRIPKNEFLDMLDLCKGTTLNHNYNSWKFNRQIFSRAIRTACYSDETIEKVNNIFEEMMDYWMNLRKPDENFANVDAAAWMPRFINDSISAITTGNRTFAIKNYYHKLKTNEVTKEIMESEHFIDCLNSFNKDGHMIFIPKFLRPFPLINGRVNKFVHMFDDIYKRLVEMIRKRRKEVEKLVNSSNFDQSQLKNDLLTSMIVANTPYETTPQQNVDPSLLRPMTDDEIRGIMFDAFMAGTDSTTNTFCFVLYYISHHPHVKKKLLEEIETVFKDDPYRAVTIKDLNKFKYCEAIIKETSRIRTPVSLNSRYLEQPEEIAGYKWPSDILFVMYTRGINNNPLYWKDPEKFDPERFYDPSAVENQHKFAFSMFGGGVRNCLGKNLAMMELKIFLVLLYRKFNVELVDMKAPLNVETST
ncbi:24148_t:CDS:2, partial [Racocetra persica]